MGMLLIILYQYLLSTAIVDVYGSREVNVYIIELTRVLIRRDCSFNNLHHEGTVSLQDCNTYIVITSCTGSLNLGPI